MELFVFWLLFAAVVGIVAASRGRSGFGWFGIAVLISPLLGIILVALLPSLKGAPAAQSQNTHRPCPECAELVLRAARKCKHCGAALVPPAADETACGSCRGIVPRWAPTCKHCGVDLAWPSDRSVTAGHVQSK